jgi:hypothetical protein
MPLDDTSPDSHRVHGDVLRSLTGAQRLQAASDLTLLAFQVTRAGLRDRHPGASEEQLDAEHYRLVFGAELAGKVLEYRRRLRQSRSESV